MSICRCFLKFRFAFISLGIWLVLVWRLFKIECKYVGVTNKCRRKNNWPNLCIFFYLISRCNFKCYQFLCKPCGTDRRHLHVGRFISVKFVAFLQKMAHRNDKKNIKTTVLTAVLTAGNKEI